jgi:hypothetical protein
MSVPNDTRLPLLTASTDRTLPKKHEGKLEPNYYCRGWNAKRLKYCKQRAGHGTSHKGVGRCFQHGGLKRSGDDRVTNGRNSRVKATALGDLIDTERNRTDPLDLSGELATLRALVADLRARNPEAPDHQSEIALARETGIMVERIERIRSQNAISRPELGRIMQEIWRSIDARVEDVAVKADIREDLLRISL